MDMNLRRQLIADLLTSSFDFDLLTSTEQWDELTCDEQMTLYTTCSKAERGSASDLKVCGHTLEAATLLAERKTSKPLKWTTKAFLSFTLRK